MGNDNFTIAFQLHTMGYSVIPSGAGENGKHPLVSWAQYQEQAPDDDDLDAWEAELHPQLWGIVTNEDVAVIDANGTDTRSELETELGNPHVITPRGGGHWYINTTGHPFPTKTGVLQGIDVRGEGGFVNISGRSALGEYKILTLPSPDTLIPWEKVPERLLSALTSRKPLTGSGEFIREGNRNERLTSVAGSLRNQGLDQPAIEASLLIINDKRCQPPLPENEIKKIATSISRYPTASSGNKKSRYTLPKDRETATKHNKTTTENTTTEAVFQRDIEEWISRTNGAWFTNDELDRDLGYLSPNQKKKRGIAIERLASKGIVQRHPNDNKRTRKVTTDVRRIDFKAAGKRTPLDIGLPFDIQKLVHIYPGNIIVLAGAANTGKTAFMLNVIRLNMHFFPVFYWSSEMGKDELALRLERFPGIGLGEWNFEAWERTRDFADVIVPDAINIIDYYEFAGGEAFYQISEGFRAIWEKLGTGIALVAIQKARNRQTGRGGDFGLEKPRLYLSMDTGKLRIIKGKNCAIPGSNPDGLTIEFKLTDGCNFIITREWYRPQE